MLPADSAAQPFVSSSWPIVLDEVFAAPTWTLVLSEGEEEVLGPVVRFSRTFLWIVLSSGLAVLLSEHQPDPPEPRAAGELNEGTRRIAQRDFGSRVSVTSRDEFEELAGSFNAMAMQLGRQFQALATAAELDRAVLSATDVASIVDTLLARTRDVFPCHLVGVTLVASDGGKSLMVEGPAQHAHRHERKRPVPLRRAPRRRGGHACFHVREGSDVSGHAVAGPGADEHRPNGWAEIAHHRLEELDASLQDDGWRRV